MCNSGYWARKLESQVVKLFPILACLILTWWRSKTKTKQITKEKRKHRISFYIWFSNRHWSIDRKWPWPNPCPQISRILEWIIRHGFLRWEMHSHLALTSFCPHFFISTFLVLLISWSDHCSMWVLILIVNLTG